MENNLLRSIKLRLMDELRDSVQQNLLYRDKVKVYHKFPYTERPNFGVVLRNASSSRIKLSADDAAGTLKSHLTLASAENVKGEFLSWVWEDPTYMTGLRQDEDLSSQIEGTPTYGQNRVFYTSKKPIISGKGNTTPADNFRQIVVKLNGQIVFSEYVNGSKGMFMLPQAPVVGDTLTVNYYYNNLTPPGRYYIKLISSFEFTIDPLYQVRAEEVIERTLGTELSATLDHGNLYGNFDVLYTVKTKHSNKIFLENGIDYTIDNFTGIITLLTPLPVDTTLYADYRWHGALMGPFRIPEPYHYNNTALPGVILAFTNRFEVDDELVVIVYPQREPAAQVYSGHYSMSFDLDVFSRDPAQLADLTDFIIEDMWGNRRLPLIDEGITIEELDPSGESEDVYDENTGDLYYKNSISLQIMTEWKKFVPLNIELMDFDTKLYQYITNKEYELSNQGTLALKLKPVTTPFEVKYPKIGYAKYF